MKSSIYLRSGLDEQTIKNNCILYVYGKSEESINIQEEKLSSFCKEWLLNPVKVYKDYGGSNFLENKSNLMKLFSENQDIDMIIFSFDRISGNLLEVMKIDSLSSDKNIRIYDIKNNAFVSELFQSDIAKKIKEELSL